MSNSRWTLVDQLEDLRLDGNVERGRRLVGDEDGRAVHEGHRDHRALAHAAGELVRKVASLDRGAFGMPTGVSISTARFVAAASPTRRA